MKKFWDSHYMDTDFEDTPSRSASPVSPEKHSGVVPQILALIAVCIVLALIFGTAAAFATKKAQFAAGLRRADPKPSATANAKNASYMDLGRLRLQTADENVVLILEPWFPYQQNDTDFIEEISSKKRAIKIAITSYFRTHTKQQLLSAGENTVKSDLLGEINGMLISGKFSAIYFSEYLFLN